MKFLLNIIHHSFLEVLKFISTHLISGMIPAFFIAGAIYVFIDKQKITKYLGKNSPRIISYTIASLAGAILTVCSCGVLPIFASIYKQGAGIGPAFTFLFAAPAINAISIIYTNSFLGFKFTIARIILVIINSVLIGFCIEKISCFSNNLFQNEQSSNSVTQIIEDDDLETEDRYWKYKIIFLFSIILFIMITGSGLLDMYIRKLVSYIFVLSPNKYVLAKVIIILLEYNVFFLFVWYYFSYYELKLLFKKTFELMTIIFPKVLIGIFISSVITFILNNLEIKYISFVESNSYFSNLVASFIGSMMYFGSIVGVNIVATLVNFGMHQGPAMTLTLSGPAVSLPSFLSLYPIIGLKYTIFFVSMVILYSSILGWIFGYI